MVLYGVVNSIGGNVKTDVKAGWYFVVVWLLVGIIGGLLGGEKYAAAFSLFAGVVQMLTCKLALHQEEKRIPRGTGSCLESFVFWLFMGAVARRLAAISGVFLLGVLLAGWKAGAVGVVFLVLGWTIALGGFFRFHQSLLTRFER